VVEAFGATVAGPVDKVIGDLVQPILQRPAKLIQPFQPGLPCLVDPGPQPCGPGRGVGNRAILEHLLKCLAVLDQRLQARIDSGSTGSVKARVDGNKGDDNLTLNVIDNSGGAGASTLSALKALIDGGKGFDTCVHTSNVVVKRCEA